VPLTLFICHVRRTPLYEDLPPQSTAFSAYRWCSSPTGKSKAVVQEDNRQQRKRIRRGWRGLTGGTGGSGASGGSGGYFYFFLTFPPARSPATNCGYLCLHPEEVIFRSN
jgi:hypothetical protein